jgi:hypothetical protein
VASLRIPKRYKPGFEKLRSLSDSSFESLRVELEKCPPMVRVEAIANYLASSVPEVRQDDLELILSSLCMTYIIRVNLDVSIQRIASDVAEAMRSEAEDQSTVSEAGYLKLKERLGRLLAIDSLTYASKAIELRNDFLCLFCDARVLTDLRPIFAKPEQKALGAIITHTLKLEYHEHGEHKEIYVALDSEDIVTLKKMLERAESKEQSLRTNLRDFGMADAGAKQ